MHSHWRSSKDGEETPATMQHSVQQNQLHHRSNFYLQYSGGFYRQKHSCARGSSVSLIVANLIMEEVESRALITFTETAPRHWFRNVEDTSGKITTSGSFDRTYKCCRHCWVNNPQVALTTQTQSSHVSSSTLKTLPNAQTPLQLVRTGEASWMRGKTSSRNWNSPGWNSTQNYHDLIILHISDSTSRKIMFREERGLEKRKPWQFIYLMG